MIAKACPVVLHPEGVPARALFFEHPLAGTQLVKGTVDPGETPLTAAARELFEETGLRAKSGLPLTDSNTIVPGEHWHFALIRVRAPVPVEWSHKTNDDGGQVFRCGWLPLNAPSPFQGRFARAWAVILAAIGSPA